MSIRTKIFSLPKLMHPLIPATAVDRCFMRGKLSGSLFREAGRVKASDT